MRVVGGVARGRRLVAPPGTRTRPTTDRVKEALFSIVQAQVPGSRVVDLYAGSGALAIEALSRGATAATLVERERGALRALRENLDAVDLPGATVLAVDVRRALAGSMPNAPFTLAVLDPPYDLSDEHLGDVLVALVDHLDDGAVVVVERAVRSGPPAWPATLTPDRVRRYGDTAVHVARRVVEGRAAGRTSRKAQR